jgi:hypothetical protein
MIAQRNISIISNQLSMKGAKRVPESVIERDYVLAWLLTGLANHSLREILIFKGGTALRRCWIDHYRFSEDLDFTLTKPVEFSKILLGLNEIFQLIFRECGLKIEFDRVDKASHRNSHTFYLKYQGPLPAPNDVKVDITINEVFCFDTKSRPIFQTYVEYEDLPQGPMLNVYALEEIVIEKISALSDRARNEPRDLYDLWHLLGEHSIVLQELRPELERKLAYRNRLVNGVEQAIALKSDRLKRLWVSRLAHQMSDLPKFDGVFRDVMRAIRAADLPQ